LCKSTVFLNKIWRLIVAISFLSMRTLEASITRKIDTEDLTIELIYDRLSVVVQHGFDTSPSLATKLIEKAKKLGTL
jgi:hypothetical protein